jgi:hypothetical protein
MADECCRRTLRENRIYSVRFEFLTVPNVKVTASWDIVLCSFIEVDRRFRGVYCRRYQRDRSGDGGSKHLLERRLTSMGLHGAISQKAVLFTFTAMGNFLAFHVFYLSFCLGSPFFWLCHRSFVFSAKKLSTFPPHLALFALPALNPFSNVLLQLT